MNPMTATDTLSEKPLALLGGPPVIADPNVFGDLFKWPIVTGEDEQAVLEVLRAGTMSELDVTHAFEREFAAWQGVRHALAYCNGTMALEAAMWAAGLRRGDELICPSITYWASGLQAFRLGASVVFADSDPETLCMDPADVERRISPRTRALMVVHYCGHPCDMDALVALARKHNLKLIEDVSHAHGALYKGRMVGTFGCVAAMSMMTGKSFPIGEGGMLVTDDDAIYQRAVAYSHYRMHPEVLQLPELKKTAGLPLGGVKGRLTQTASAMGRVQLRHYPARIKAIQAALNRFWDLLAGTPGLRAHRPPAGSGSTMGGWYNPLGHYRPEELDGLPLERFGEALASEGLPWSRGINAPLHIHPVFNEADIYGDGKPTRNAFADRDLRQAPESLPVAAGVGERTFGIPYFKHDREALITLCAAAVRKVAARHKDLL